MTTLPKPIPAQTRVLLVDDLPAVRDLTRMQLRRREDIEIVGEAGDGLEAIQRSAALQPDLVICDISMPRLSGIDAIPHMREAAPRARILMLSSNDDDLTIRRALNAGADGYAVKGLPRQRLLAKIDDVMGQPRT